MSGRPCRDGALRVTSTLPSYAEALACPSLRGYSSEASQGRVEGSFVFWWGRLVVMGGTFRRGVVVLAVPVLGVVLVELVALQHPCTTW